MKYLLDTHILLWSLMDDKNLSKVVREQIVNENNIIFVSAASTWEITIKKSLGKLDTPENLESEFINSRFTMLPIQISHTITVGNLPHHHADPFDRLLIAQCKEEKLSLITHDHNIIKYHNEISILSNRG